MEVLPPGGAVSKRLSAYMRVPESAARPPPGATSFAVSALTRIRRSVAQRRLTKAGRFPREKQRGAPRRPVRAAPRRSWKLLRIKNWAPFEGALRATEEKRRRPRGAPCTYARTGERSARAQSASETEADPLSSRPRNFKPPDTRAPAGRTRRGLQRKCPDRLIPRARRGAQGRALRALLLP